MAINSTAIISETKNNFLNFEHFEKKYEPHSL